MTTEAVVEAPPVREPWTFPMPEGLAALETRETPLVPDDGGEGSPIYDETWQAVYAPPGRRPAQRRKVKDAPQA